MRFRHFDSLRIFTVVATHRSLTSAAEELNLTKGAVSHQIRNLEHELQFSVLKRSPQGIELTEQGKKLLQISKHAFGEIEQRINQLRKNDEPSVTLAVSTYFAARWLSPRLMHFMIAHPDIKIRIQPMAELQEIDDPSIDLAVRWGDGNWPDTNSKCLFLCPAFPTGPKGISAKIKSEGLGAQKMLRDWKHSTAWREWHGIAGLPFERKSDSLVIPDPNVRVQAVIDGQGIALNDRLVEAELSEGKLERISDFELNQYGYFLIYLSAAKTNKAALKFAHWLHEEGDKEPPIS